MSNIDKTFELLREENQKLKEKLALIQKISNSDVPESKSDIDYKLEVVSGTYLPFETIISQIKNEFNEIKKIYDAAKTREQQAEAVTEIRKLYMDKYYVEYKYVKKDMPTVHCYYMNPTLSKIQGLIGTPEVRFEPTLKLELDNGSYMNLIQCEQSMAKYYSLDPPINIFINTPNIYYKDILDMNKLNVLYISKVVSKEQGKGYMNILLCLAAKFANSIMKKDMFLLDADSFGYDVDSSTLINKVYPSFGFKVAKQNSMYAYIKDIVALDKCNDLKVK